MSTWKRAALIGALGVSAALKAPVVVGAVANGGVVAGGWPAVGGVIELVLAGALMVSIARPLATWTLLWGATGAILAAGVRTFLDGPRRSCGCLGVIEVPNGVLLLLLGIILWLVMDLWKSERRTLDREPSARA